MFCLLVAFSGKWRNIFIELFVIREEEEEGNKKRILFKG
jgi:hypothetical protein